MGFDIGYGAAAFAGLLSFLSPCILPIVPFYLCYISGLSFEALTEDREVPARRRVILSSIAFALGMTVIFVGLGASATLLGEQVRAYNAELRWIAAGIILVLGLHFLGILRIGFLMREARIDTGDESPLGYLGAFLVGMAFAFGWTPCVGPALAAILFMAGDAASAWEGAALLAAYAAGMTLPFILAAIFIGPFLNWARGFRRHLPTVERVMGAFLVVFAALIASNSMNVIANWMLQIAPDIGTLQ